MRQYTFLSGMVRLLLVHLTIRPKSTLTCFDALPVLDQASQGQEAQNAQHALDSATTTIGEQKTAIACQQANITAAAAQLAEAQVSLQGFTPAGNVSHQTQFLSLSKSLLFTFFNAAEGGACWPHLAKLYKNII